MTNEKLCTLIQQGQKEYLADLWEQTRRFGAMQARRYFVSLGNLGGVELEDLLQCRWSALVQAVRYFRAEQGCFLTLLRLHAEERFPRGCRPAQQQEGPSV